MLLLWYALKWPLGAYASSARSSHWYHQHVQWGGTRWHAVTLVQCNWCSGMFCTYQTCCAMGTPKCDPAGNADPGIPRGRVGPLEMANSGRFQPFVFHVCRRTDPFSWAVQACDKGLLSYILWNFSRTFHGIAVLADVFIFDQLKVQRLHPTWWHTCLSNWRCWRHWGEAARRKNRKMSEPAITLW